MEKHATSINRTVAEHSLSGIRSIMLPLWLIIAVLVAAIMGVLSYLTEFDRSVWATGASATKVYLGVVGIIIGVTILPLYVTNGITRRHFATGGSLVVAGTALVSGLFALLGFGIEEIVYGLADLSHLLEDVAAFGSAGRAATIFIAYAAASAAYMCSGWLIGSGFYRFGPFGGTLFILVALIPVVGTEYLISVESIWDSGVSIGGPVGAYASLPERVLGDVDIPVAVAALISFAVTALGLLVNYRLLRDVTIK